jgi:hypothetical protein
VTGSTTVCSVFYDAGAIAPGDSLSLAPDDPLASGGLGRPVRGLHAGAQADVYARREQVALLVFVPGRGARNNMVEAAPSASMAANAPVSREIEHDQVGSALARRWPPCA